MPDFPNKLSRLFLLLILSFSWQLKAQIIVNESSIPEAKRLLDLSQQKLSVVREADTEFSSANIDFDQRQLIESELTLLENRNQLIPFQGLDTLRIAALSLGSPAVTPFQKMLYNYTKVDYFNLSSNFTEAEAGAVLEKLAGYNLVITGIHSLTDEKSIPANGNRTADSYSADKAEKLLGRLTPANHSVVVLFLNPMAVKELNELSNPDGLLMAYQNTTNSQKLAAQLLFGGIGAKGRLPFPFGEKYKTGDGLNISHSVRLKYTLPEEVGLNSVKLNHRVDSIVNNALEKRAFPGCNVLVAKDGKVIFQKAYGFHTFENRTPATLDDIYDLASVTKVSGALPAIMKLNEEGKYLLDEKFSTYWGDWRKGFLHPSNKSGVTVRELLTHQAGLVPYMPFWKQSVTEKGLSHKWYHVEQNDQFDLQVAPGLYLDSKFKNKVYKSIRKSPLETRGKYVYSCLSFIIAPEVISKLAGMKFTDYLDQNFYRPLGATTVTYLPSQKFSDDQIVPTEYDSIFRKKLVHSSVHDEASAVLGGISGNAGLFASANDLAKLVQMYVQYGTYGGKQYLKRTTLEEFTRIQYPQNNNRRGLGFDKPLIGNQKMDKAHAYPCPGASPKSFGHFGFTGTFFWADPDNGLVYIFLSNRVYPTRENNKISDLNIRTDILQELYDELSILH
jgi:beta-N-acetylhexosaminidase